MGKDMRSQLGLIFAAGALALIGCSDGQLSETEVITDETVEAEGDEPMQLTPVDTPEDVEALVLASISYAEIETELESGAGCSVVEDGKALLVAVEGDAIAKPNGTMRHFEFAGDLDALWDGGTFTAGAISIRVTPMDVEGERIDEVVSKPATVIVSEDGRDGQTEIRAEWQCGA